MERIVKFLKSNKATNLWRRRRRRGEGGVGKKGGVKFLPLLDGYKK